jgi:hypothetical protein
LAWDQENLGSNPRSPTSFCGVAKWQGNWLLPSSCAGSNPAPTANQCRGRLLVEGPSPTKRCSRVRSSTPVPEYRLRACGRADSGIALLKRYTLVRIQPGVPCRGRSVAGRRSLKPSTLVRFQHSAPNSVLAWCTVHRRTYKPLRSRSEHGLGSTPSASTNAFEAHKDEQTTLNRQAVGSIPTGRTKFLELWPNGEALDF